MVTMIPKQLFLVFRDVTGISSCMSLRVDPLRVTVCYRCRVLSVSLSDLCKFNLNWSLKGRLEHRNVLASQLSCHFNSFVLRYWHKVFDIAHLVAGRTNVHFSTCTCVCRCTCTML